MVTNESSLKIPIQYLIQYVDKDTRIELFKSIMDEYPKRFSQLQKVLGYLNWDPDSNFDYIAIFKAPNNQGKMFILYDYVSMGNLRSIPGYRYCVLNDMTDTFFTEGFRSFVPMEQHHFDDLLLSLELSKSKTSPVYWKNPKNLPVLLNHLRELGLRYKPQITF